MFSTYISNRDNTYLLNNNDYKQYKITEVKNEMYNNGISACLGVIPAALVAIIFLSVLLGVHTPPSDTMFIVSNAVSGSFIVVGTFFASYFIHQARKARAEMNKRSAKQEQDFQEERLAAAEKITKQVDNVITDLKNQTQYETLTTQLTEAQKKPIGY